MSEENVSGELALLAHEAAAADEAAGVGMEGGPAPLGGIATDYHKEAATAVGIFADLLAGYAPATASIWTPEARARTAAALGPVLGKYGVTLGNLPPEITLAVVAGPLLWQSARLVAAQAQSDKAAAPGAVIDTPAHEHHPMTHPQTALYEQG